MATTWQLECAEKAYQRRLDDQSRNTAWALSAVLSSMSGKKVNPKSLFKKSLQELREQMERKALGFEPIELDDDDDDNEVREVGDEPPATELIIDPNDPASIDAYGRAKMLAMHSQQLEAERERSEKLYYEHGQGADFEKWLHGEIELWPS